MADETLEIEVRIDESSALDSLKDLEEKLNSFIESIQKAESTDKKKKKTAYQIWYAQAQAEQTKAQQKRHKQRVQAGKKWAGKAQGLGKISGIKKGAGWIGKMARKTKLPIPLVKGGVAGAAILGTAAVAEGALPQMLSFVEGMLADKEIEWLGPFKEILDDVSDRITQVNSMVEGAVAAGAQTTQLSAAKLRLHGKLATVGSMHNTFNLIQEYEEGSRNYQREIQKDRQKELSHHIGQTMRAVAGWGQK